ncbi:MAG TPA: 5-formyltetrahydrofolate cyclo-ligase [Gammaproteobacteria bacterium]
MGQHKEHNAPSSPACLMHEFAAELLPRPGGHGLEWPAVHEFRQGKRAELLERRRALDLDDRKRLAKALSERLLASVDLRAFSVLGFYWPIRGELDLRGIAREHCEAGGRAALPVVVAKNEPVEFWRWETGSAMQRGFWNIPVPLERRCLTPHALLIPLVGYDTAGYRLGYGGGFYDRTLAALTPRPFCIGVGLDDSELETIHPQPHDIPMNLIVTERRILQFVR